jgi:hypothetical protein
MKYGTWVLLTSLGLMSFCFLLSPVGGGEWRPSGEVGLFCSRAASPLVEADWRRFLEARPLGPAEKCSALITGKAALITKKTALITGKTGMITGNDFNYWENCFDYWENGYDYWENGFAYRENGFDYWENGFDYWENGAEYRTLGFHPDPCTNIIDWIRIWQASNFEKYKKNVFYFKGHKGGTYI